jgi:hypothetical protein
MTPAFRRIVCVAVVAGCILSGDGFARDAAFMEPGGGGLSATDDVIKVEPKSEIDIGESSIGVAKRVDLFFANHSTQPVKVEKVVVNADSNVVGEIASNDCAKQGVIASGSRCNVGISVTPSSSGQWGAEVLMTHDGAGRISRAKLTGKTAGTASGDKKEMGLALNTKEINPVVFGDVEIGGGKVVRSALMVNDSGESITIYAIDVIEASNGLARLDQGCVVDMELKPGESCPVTLVWTPNNPGQVSTDLIIRHSGRLGFAVVPIRGMAKGTAIASSSERSGGLSGDKSTNALPAPPSAQDIAKAVADKIAPISSSALSLVAGESSADKAAAEPVGKLSLIGTVGSRAVLLKPDGKTVIASAGDDIDMGKYTARLLALTPRSADVMVDGKKVTLALQASQDLIAKAASTVKDKPKDSVAVSGNTGGSEPVAPVGASGAPSGSNFR